jgi:hypothetical protein
MDLDQTACWGNIKEAGAEITILARDASSVDLESATINITIPKPPWHQGSAVRLFMLLSLMLAVWAGYSWYRLSTVNIVSQQLSIAENLLDEKLTVIEGLSKQLAIATNQPVVTNYVTSTQVVRIKERVPVYDIPQGMPKAGPATNDVLVANVSEKNQHTLTKFVAYGDGTVFLTPNDWAVNCLVYGNVADFDRLVNIGGLTNPHWIHYGSGTELPAATKVVAYWIRNRVQNSNLKVEFVLTPVVPTTK